MAFSFSNWFKKPTSAPEGGTATAPAPAAGFPSAPPAPRVTVTAPAPAPVRTLKTVVPNSVRPVNLREGLARPGGANALTAPSPASLRPGAAAVPSSGTRPIAFPGMVPVSPVAAPAPAVAAPAPKAPPAAAGPASLAFNPAPGATVSIPLGEFFDRIPSNLLRPGAAVDRDREVVLQAGDLYSDLARGRASVPVSAVQAACPDLFGRPVSPTEDVEVALPLQLVIEQLANTFQARPDQVPEEDVAEIETPFLQVALEDSVRLPKPPASVAPPPRPVVAPVAPPPAPARNPLAKTGTVAGAEALTIRALTPRQAPSAPHAPAHAPVPPPPNPLAPPTRDSVAPINTAKRPPSTVRASVAGGKIRLSGPAISSRSIAPAAAHSTPAALAPSAPPAVLKPTVPAPSPAAAAAAASLPAQKKTARIQIPPIALRPPGGPASPAAPTAASRPLPASGGGAPPRSAAFPEPLVSFRATPGEGPTAPAMPPPTGTPPRPLPMPGLGGPRPVATPGGAPPPMMPFAPVAFTPPPAVAPVVPSAAPAPAAAEEDDGLRIALALAPILRTLPDGMFAHGLDGYAAAEQVPDQAKVEFPLGFITAQLAQGRVAVPRARFVEAMPAECRHLLPPEGEPAEVVIPLQEVFQNLPTGALSRRNDQVMDEVGPEIPTPFSQKAQEDAQRLAPPPAPEPEAIVEPEPEPVAVIAEPEPEATAAVVEEEAAETPAAPVAEADPTLEEAAPEGLTAETAAPVADEAPAVEDATPEPAPEPIGAVIEEPIATEPVTDEENEAVAPEPTTPEAAEETETPAVAEVEAEAIKDEATAEEEAPEIVAAAEEVPAIEPEAPAPVDEPTAVAEPVADEPEPVPVRDLTPAPDRFAPDGPGTLLPPAAAATNGQHRHVPSPATAPAPAASLEEIQEALRAIFMVDDDLDAKKVVRLVAGLPGLKACAVMFGDGLKLAGELENGLSSSEGFCAMTPPFFRRVRAYAGELGLGETQSVTLQTERALLSFFMAGDICLSIQHAGNRGFLPGVREKLTAATAELARMYATPVSARR